jgi:hypothetical protein
MLHVSDFIPFISDWKFSSEIHLGEYILYMPLLWFNVGYLSLQSERRIIIPPTMKLGGILESVCLSVRLSVDTNLYFLHLLGLCMDFDETLDTSYTWYDHVSPRTP